MRWALLWALVACEPISDDELPPAGELALYRVQHGESIGAVAEKLQFPGGYRALNQALGKRSDELRVDEGLAIPTAYLRGREPSDLGLEPYVPPLPDEPVTPCRTFEGHGSCVEVGDRTICLEETPPRDPSRDLDDCTWQADDATECAAVPGRELVLYRGAERRVISVLPSGGRWRRGELELEAHLVDLDGDRADELLAIVPLDVYSRFSIDTRRLFVLDGRSERVVQLDVQQWGDGSIVANERATCDVMITSWEDGYLDPRLPAGFYFVGRRYGYERGELLPRGERRVRRQRETLFHVANEELVRPALPGQWLTEPGSSRWTELPARGDFRRGRIANLEAHPAAGLILDIAFADGTTARFDPMAKEATHLRLLGWAPTASPLAPLYIPGEPARWRGAEVLVDVPADPDRDFGREVWIAP